MIDSRSRHDDDAWPLASLGLHEPSAGRDARVRARCHAALGRRRRREAAPERSRWRGALEPALVGTLCAVYLFEVLSRAVRLYRF